MINVTKTFLPPIDEYTKQVKRAWDNKWLTNRGELVLELEKKMKAYLGLNHILITNNGTMPLQIALKLLGNVGEIITTPFSYVATSSAIVWENCTPVFVDIHPEYLTIDETKIEEAITSKTTAILATHVFGNPCAIEALEILAKKYNLKVIYDAAHCFGVKYHGKSIFEFGDISTCSFHATKLFHTGEGGALFATDTNLQDQLFYSHNFGHDGPEAFHGLGINAKMSELQAAMGLAVFPYMDEILDQRKVICNRYVKAFEKEEIKLLKVRVNTKWNYCYFPIILKNEHQLFKIKQALENNEIYPRRYFYPSLNNLSYLKNNVKMPISDSIASRILCLPLYSGLLEEEVSKIILIVLKNK